MWNLGDNAVEVKGIGAEGKSAGYSAGISQLIQVVAPRASCLSAGRRLQ